MSLIYITGISGSGKSTLARSLKKLGYEAIDADNEGYNQWVDRKTGKPATPTSNEEVRHPQWLSRHGWSTNLEEIQELARRAEKKTIFFLSTTENEREYWNLSSKVFCLVIDEQTLRHRIATRDGNIYGKQKHELDAILKWHPGSEAHYRRCGAQIIDAMRPFEKVLEEIIQTTSS